MRTNARVGAVTAGGELVNIRLLVGCLVLPCNQVRPNRPNLSVDAYRLEFASRDGLAPRVHWRAYPFLRCFAM